MDSVSADSAARAASPTTTRESSWTFDEAKRFLRCLRETGDLRAIASAMGTKTEEQLMRMFEQVKQEMKSLYPSWRENDFDEVLKIIDLEQRLHRCSKRHGLNSSTMPFVGLLPSSKKAAFEHPKVDRIFVMLAPRSATVQRRVAEMASGSSGRLRVKMSASHRMRDLIDFVRKQLRLEGVGLRLYATELGYARGWGSSSSATVGDLHRLLERPAELVMRYDFDSEPPAVASESRSSSSSPVQAEAPIACPIADVPIGADLSLDDLLRLDAALDAPVPFDRLL